MRVIVVFLVLALAVGCGEKSAFEAELEGTVVFYNFYDELVEAYVDDELLFAERLQVDDSSTGLSKMQSLSLSGCSQIMIATSSHQTRRQVCPEKGGFGLWVSPASYGGPITIKFEEVFTPALDCVPTSAFHPVRDTIGEVARSQKQTVDQCADCRSAVSL